MYVYPWSNSISQPMIPFIIASIPIEVQPSRSVDWFEINKSAQLSTKETYSWWWNKYGCEGTQWYPVDEQCRDLTNDR